MLIGILILLTGFAYGWWETTYFGNNMYPQSEAEAFADFMSGFLYLSGLTIYIYARLQYRKINKNG